MDNLPTKEAFMEGAKQAQNEEEMTPEGMPKV